MNQLLWARLSVVRLCLEGNSSRTPVPSKRMRTQFNPGWSNREKNEAPGWSHYQPCTALAAHISPPCVCRELQSDVSAYLGFLAAGTPPTLLLSIPRCVVGCLLAARRSALHIKATWLCLSFPKADSKAAWPRLGGEKKKKKKNSQWICSNSEVSLFFLFTNPYGRVKSGLKAL